MKKMISVKSMCSVVVAACFLCTSLQAMPVSTNKSVNDKIIVETSPVGEWNYTAEGTSYEYSKGVLVVKKIEENYEVTVRVNNAAIKAEQVKVAGKALDFVIYVEGQKVTVNLTWDGNEINGKAESTDGVFPIKGTRSIVD